MSRDDRPLVRGEDRFGGVLAPRPRVAEPQRRQQMQTCRLRTAVVHGATDQDVIRAGLGVLEEHVVVAIVIEHAGVEQFVLELFAREQGIGLDQAGVRKGPLRVLVQVLHVRVGRRRVEVEVVLLDVLAVVPLAVGQAEQPLLEDGVVAVPQGERETEPLLVVGDAAQPVLAPAIRAQSRLVMREVVPRVAVLAVVLAHGAPLALTEVRSPLLPRDTRLACLVQPPLFTHVHERAARPAGFRLARVPCARLLARHLVPSWPERTGPRPSVSAERGA